MFIPGKSYRLPVLRIDQSVIYLKTDTTPLSLPKRMCPDNIAPGDLIEVFLYIDRNDELKATTRIPIAQVGEFALLRVTSIGPHGAFLDWGIDKDLLAPHPEQARKMLEGRDYLVRIFSDNRNRPTASSRLEKFLTKENEDLTEGEQVDLLLWAFTDLGAKVIVNNRYEALIYRDSLPVGLKRGERLKGYVLRIREDRRIDISLKQPGAAGVSAAREVILAALAEDPFLPLHDQSPPEQIWNHLGLSKKVFKKAVGGLYKDGLIELADGGIRLKG